MPNTVRRLEELSFRTLPALDQERYDGWVLRWSDGGSRRANSVTAVHSSSLPILGKIKHCEEWFAARGAPPIFRLTPLADTKLDEALDGSGYRRSSPTAVMTARLTNHETFAEVDLIEHPSDEWLQSIPGIGRDRRSLERLRHQLTTSGGSNRFASISHGEDIVAIGMSLDLGGVTTVYNMNTVAAERRRGHARKILSTLLACGVAAGTDRAVLQVTWDNAAAMALYGTVGFSTAYDYHYRELPPN